MPEMLEKLKERFFDFWNKLDKNQKSRLVISTLVFLVAIIGVVSFSVRKDYVPVFTVSNPRDMPEIEMALNDRGISFEHGDHSTILVDKADTNEAEFVISAIPNLSSTVSIEDTWNRINMSSTESDKKHLWEDFKRNNLIAKLKMFDNVADADVDLSIPEQKMIFSNQPQQEPTAFVRITPTGEISREQVQGVASVVASSIGGMDPQDVTVVDNNLNPLNNMSSDTMMGAVSNHYDMRQRIKQEMENDVRNLYRGDFENFDYINVVANPVLDFDKESQVSNEVKPPTDMEEAIVSQSNLQERIMNNAPGGPDGVDGNPPQFNIEGDDEDSEYEKTSTTTNYDYTRVNSTWEKALGSIDYDSSSLTVALWYGDRVEDDEGLTDDFINALRDDVSNATGIPAPRISINTYQLAAEPVIDPVRTEIVREFIDDYGLFIAVILMLIVFMIAVPKKVRESQPELALADGFDESVGEDYEEVDLAAQDGKSEPLRQIENFVQEKPDAVVQLLRNWLQDDEYD